MKGKPEIYPFMRAGLTVVISERDFSDLESSYPSCQIQFAVTEFLREPRQGSGPSRDLKPTVLMMVAAFGTGFSQACATRCNFAGCRHVLFALPSVGRIGTAGGRWETHVSEDLGLKRLDAAVRCEKLALTCWRHHQPLRLYLDSDY